MKEQGTAEKKIDVDGIMAMENKFTKLIGHEKDLDIQNMLKNLYLPLKNEDRMMYLILRDNDKIKDLSLEDLEGYLDFTLAKLRICIKEKKNELEEMFEDTYIKIDEEKCRVIAHYYSYGYVDFIDWMYLFADRSKYISLFEKITNYLNSHKLVQKIEKADREKLKEIIPEIGLKIERFISDCGLTKINHKLSERDLEEKLYEANDNGSILDYLAGMICEPEQNLEDRVKKDIKRYRDIINKMEFKNKAIDFIYEKIGEIKVKK